METIQKYTKFCLVSAPRASLAGQAPHPPLPTPKPPHKRQFKHPHKNTPGSHRNDFVLLFGGDPAVPSTSQCPAATRASVAQPSSAGSSHGEHPARSSATLLSLSIQGLCNARHSPAPAPHGAALGARAGLCWAFADKQILPPQQSPSCPQRSQSNQTEWKRRQPLH